MIFILLFANDIYQIGLRIQIPFVLSASMELFVAISTFSNIFTHFANGLGKIQLQVMSIIFADDVNIVLTIYLFKDAAFGLTEIAASYAGLSISAVLIAIQYIKIINFRASGILNK